MDQTNQELISRARNLVSKGDYHQARKTIRYIESNANLSDDDLAEMKRIMTATGMDPYVVAIVVFTFAVWAFLFIKYVL